MRQHGDEVYRCTLKPDGHWVTCDKYENGVGDNIALVQELEPGTGFAESVYRLSGAPSVAKATRPAPAPVKREPPKMPAQDAQDVKRGRAYLFERGITLETIERAERSGMLRYARGSVLFVGRDSGGGAQSVTSRAIDPAAPIQKRDLRGSDKSYPPVLMGDPAAVWIVEGGADALALHDIAARAGRPVPTVLVSGGAQVRSFLERGEVQAVLRKAQRVTVAGENEKSPDAQQRADAGHERQAQRVQEITGREVRRWTPERERGKDLADVNLLELEREQEAESQNRMEYGR